MFCGRTLFRYIGITHARRVSFPSSNHGYGLFNCDRRNFVTNKEAKQVKSTSQAASMCTISRSVIYANTRMILMYSRTKADTWTPADRGKQKRPCREGARTDHRTITQRQHARLAGYGEKKQQAMTFSFFLCSRTVILSMRAFFSRACVCVYIKIHLHWCNACTHTHTQREIMLFIGKNQMEDQEWSPHTHTHTIRGKAHSHTHMYASMCVQVWKWIPMLRQLTVPHLPPWCTPQKLSKDIETPYIYMYTRIHKYIYMCIHLYTCIQNICIYIGDHYWSSHWFSNKQHYLSIYVYIHTALLPAGRAVRADVCERSRPCKGSS